MSSYSDILFSLPLQSYSMRNGILGLMGEIVVKVLCKEDLDDVSKKLRDQLLDKMEASVRMVAFLFFKLAILIILGEYISIKIILLVCNSFCHSTAYNS